MLYGSATGIGGPLGRPVFGSMGARLLPWSLSTYRVRKSHDGVTCCGRSPTSKCSTIFMVVGSMTSTVFDKLFGTYTSERADRAAPVSTFARSWAYTFGTTATVDATSVLTD